MRGLDGQVNSARADVRGRIYVLAVLACVSLTQCLNWFTFSSVDAHKFEEYYKPGVLAADATHEDVDFQIRLLLNWGPIFGVLMFPLQGWLLTQPRGLQKTLRLSLTLVMSGAVLRALPTLWAPGGSPKAVALLDMPELSLAMLHLGQILNASAGPFVMASASRLSVIWFPERQRTTATAVGSTANGAGVTVGFLLGPWLVPAAKDFSNLIMAEMVWTLIPWICAIFYLPSAPSEPPSAAAVAVAAGAASPMTFTQGLKLAVTNKNYGMLIVGAGILDGSGAAWQAVLNDMLRPGGYSDVFIGYLGFANSLTTNLGALISGRLADSRAFRQRYKAVLTMGLTAMLLAGALWAFCCTHSGAAALLVCLITVIGLGNGMANPIFYELGAELTYPAPEGTSAGILVCIWNLTSLVMIFLPCRMGLAVNWVYNAFILLSLVLVICVRERHHRPLDAGPPLVLDPKSPRAQ